MRIKLGNNIVQQNFRDVDELINLSVTNKIRFQISDEDFEQWERV